MSQSVKFLIGLAAALLMGWLYHGPLGNGERLVSGLEQQARAAIGRAELPGVDVQLGRDPLSRAATLSGTANQFQREGQGGLPGLNDLVREVEGISSIAWADEERSGRGVPLLLETLLMVTAAYLIGVGLGRLVFGRTKKQSYLD